MRCERGQATIEWVGLVLLASLVLGALVTAVPVTDGRSFGGFVSERIFCAVAGGGCGGGGEVASFAPVRPGTASFAPVRPGTASFAGSPGLGAFRARPSIVGPCTRYSCNPVLAHCTVVYKGKRGRAFCRKRAAAEAPGALVDFLESKFKACLVGATGAKAFTPFAEELLRKEATKSVKHAFRAIKKGLRRARKAVVKGKAKPGLVGCLGGTIGL